MSSLRPLIVIFVLLCVSSYTGARWPRAARPGPQERRTPGFSLPRQLVPRRTTLQRSPASSRSARVTEWRSPPKQPQQLKFQRWGGKNYVFQDNRWKPLFYQQGQKQGRYVGQRSQISKYPGPKERWPKPWPSQRQPQKAFKVFPANPNGISRIDTQLAKTNDIRIIDTYPVNTEFRRIDTYPQIQNNTSRPDIFPTISNSISRIDIGVVEDSELAAEPLISDAEFDGLKIYKFRGEDSMAGYVRPPVPVRWGDSLVTQRPPTTARPRPPTTPQPRPPRVTWRPELPPPFPTRHTTRRPDQENNPVIIIAQSSVQKNYLDV